MLVSSVIGDIFNPYRRTILLSWALLAINGAFILVKSTPLVNEGLLLLAINIINWSAVAHYVYYVLQEFCAILDIYVFTIKTKGEQKNKIE